MFIHKCFCFVIKDPMYRRLSFYELFVCNHFYQYSTNGILLRHRGLYVLKIKWTIKVMSSMYREVIDCIDVPGPGSQLMYSDRNDEAKLLIRHCGCMYGQEMSGHKCFFFVVKDPMYRRLSFYDLFVCKHFFKH